MNELMLHCTTEAVVTHDGELFAMLTAIPDEAQQRFPMLRYASMLPLLFSAEMPRLSDTRRAGELSAVLGEAAASHSEILRIAATASQIHAARLQGASERCRAALEALKLQFELLDDADRRRSWPTLTTIANLASLTHLALGDLDSAESWAFTAAATSPIRRDSREPQPVGRVHADAIAALVAAWRGDIHTAHERITAWDAAYGPMRDQERIVVRPLLIARAIVAFEQHDARTAHELWRALNERVKSRELRPYVLWLGAQLAASRYGPAQAASELKRHLRAMQREGDLMRSHAIMLGELLARLTLLAGTGHPQVSKGREPNLADAYAAIDAGEFVGARAIALRVNKVASEHGHVRREVESLMCAEAAEVVIARRTADTEAVQTHEVSRDGMYARRLMRDHGPVASGLAASLRAMYNSRDDLDAAAKATQGRAHVGAESNAQVISLPQPDVVRPAVETALLPQETESSSQRPVSLRRLTAAELRVLRGLAVNGNAPRTAEQLRLSVHTVRDHLKSIYRKLGVNGRSDALRVAHQLGLLHA